MSKGLCLPKTMNLCESLVLLIPAPLSEAITNFKGLQGCLPHNRSLLRRELVLPHPGHPVDNTNIASGSSKTSAPRTLSSICSRPLVSRPASLSGSWRHSLRRLHSRRRLQSPAFVTAAVVTPTVVTTALVTHPAVATPVVTAPTDVTASRLVPLPRCLAAVFTPLVVPEQIHRYWHVYRPRPFWVALFEPPNAQPFNNPTFHPLNPPTSTVPDL
jgi:hypothetical protein